MIEKNIFEICGLKQAIDICVAINYLIKDQNEKFKVKL